MLKLLIFGILAYFVYRFLRKTFLSGGGKRENSALGPVDEMVQDPNCLTYVPKGSAVRKNVGGETYYFCSQECADAFQKKQP